jgi:hypothetical protein
MLVKAEYIYQQYHNFGAAAGVVDGVDASPGPRFSGALIELSWSL